MQASFVKYTTFSSRQRSWGISLIPEVRLHLEDITYIHEGYRQLQLALKLSWLTKHVQATLILGRRSFADSAPDAFSKAFKEAASK